MKWLPRPFHQPKAGWERKKSKTDLKVIRVIWDRKQCYLGAKIAAWSVILEIFFYCVIFFCFMHMSVLTVCVSMSCANLVAMEVRTGHCISEMESQMVVTYHVSAGKWTQVLRKSSHTLTTEPPLQPLSNLYKHYHFVSERSAFKHM